MSATTRNHGLDIARSIAILFVLFAHINNNPIFCSFIQPPKIRIYGWLGVDLFFVLSGFLIGRILIKTFVNKKNIETTKELPHFYFRRWLRTLPLYYFIIPFYIGLLIFIGYDLRIFEFSNIISNLLFLQDSIIIKAYPLIDAAWSLCVEEWFYFFFPLILIFFKQIKSFFTKNSSSPITPVNLLFIIIFLYIAATIIRALLVFKLDVHSLDLYLLTQARLDSILPGVLLAYIYIFHKNIYQILARKEIFILSILFVTSITIYACTPSVFVPHDWWRNDPWFSTFSYNIMPLSWMLFIPFLENTKIKKIQFFEQTSIISYSLYLSHYLYILFPQKVIVYFFGLLDSYPNKTFEIISDILLINLILFILIYGTASILHKYVEKPFMDLRDKPIFKNFMTKVFGVFEKNPIKET